MKYSVSNRQPKDIIEKADEIIVKEKDYREIPDLFLKYPDKTIIQKDTYSTIFIAALLTIANSCSLTDEWIKM